MGARDQRIGARAGALVAQLRMCGAKLLERAALHEQEPGADRARLGEAAARHDVLGIVHLEHIAQRRRLGLGAPQLDERATRAQSIVFEG